MTVVGAGAGGDALARIRHLDGCVPVSCPATRSSSPGTPSPRTNSRAGPGSPRPPAVHRPPGAATGRTPTTWGVFATGWTPTTWGVFATGRTPTTWGVFAVGCPRRPGQDARTAAREGARAAGAVLERLVSRP
ncbi:hypothetical protein [Streptomyces sp. NPDC054804]